MSDQPMSEEAMLASLIDIRLPAEAAGGWIGELFAAVALAAFAALLVAGAARLFSSKEQAKVISPKDELAAVLGLPEPERRLELLHMLKSLNPERYAALAGELYRPAAGPDLAELEAEVAAHV